MTSRDNPLLEITAEVLLKAYSCGIFPMAERADDPQLYWIEPQERGLLPLDNITVPRRLARKVRQTPHKIFIDRDFEAVIDRCAASRPGRRSTWINSRIRSLYGDLFEAGHCHTVEVWSAEDRLIGGLYGVALDGAFFGESMFSEERDTSKIALVHLCARLIHGGYRMLDTQFVTDHLRQFGAIEINKARFHALLGEALATQGHFLRLRRDLPPDAILQIIENNRRSL
ncbi:MAG TPA: leucyl/phenylalanyl-tRNA--protein transferase [Hyphomicrobiaceae bacterium]|nr:leucyl/phenylalanyl-tRNA--protein transferase [Hyphomicrobiaceae bacterium]